MASLILEGGTFRPIFSAGVMDALLDNDIMFPYVIGVSAGICDGFSYVSRQRERNLQILMNHRNDPRYIGRQNLIKEKSLFGLNFVYNVIPNKLYPFDWDTFYKYDGKILVGVTNALTGEIEYKDGKDLDEECMMLRATCALPLVFPAINLDGIPYFDGGGCKMTYTTQMNAARAGIATKEMETVAAYEGMDLQKLMREVAAGTIVIPANKNHKCLKPFGIGNSLKTKINVNLGTSRDCLNLDVEMKKVNQAVSMGAEAIMDLSSFGDTQTFRRKLVAECPAILGTVPIYDAIVYYNKALKDITSREWIDIFKMHAEDGVDFMTIHCGINRSTADRFKAMKRQMNIVSRGGSLIFAWMEATGCENPFFEYYDEILDICNEYDVTLSLGDACRPGCLKDASDISQIEELVTLGELTARAWKSRLFLHS